MLKVLRENVKYLSWILWVFIALFIIALFVDFGGSMRSGQNPMSYAAKVGRQEISREDFYRAVQNMQQRAQQMYGEQASQELLKQLHLPQQALESEIEKAVLLGEARREGFTVSDAEVRDQILEFPMFQDENGQFVGEARYRELLQRQQYSVPAFEDEVRKEILARKLYDALEAGIFVGDQEVEKSYREQVERAKIRYLELPRSRFAQAAAVPESELAAYFNSHREEYKLPERRAVSYLLVEPLKLRDVVKVEEGDIKSYYDQHGSEFAQPEQVRARQILLLVNDQRPADEAERQLAAIKQRIERGADFGAVARQVSEDTASKPNGGDMGYFGRGRNIKEFEDAAFAAPQGKLVGPIKSPIGYHLLEVTDRKPGGTRPLAEVREQIRMQLVSEKSRQLAETRASELAKTVAGDKPKDAAAFAALGKGMVGVTAGESGKFGPSDPVPGIGISQPFSTAAFGLKGKGDVSAPVQVARGWAILYLAQIDPPHTAQLSEIEPRLRLAVATQKQQQMALDRLTEARQQLAAGKSLDQVAGELGVKAQETPEFGGQGQIPGIGYSPQIASAALALPAGQIGGPLPSTQGAILFQVIERKSWDPAKFASEREQTRTTLRQQRLTRLERALIEQRKRELGVSYSPWVVDLLQEKDNNRATPLG